MTFATPHFHDALFPWRSRLAEQVFKGGEAIARNVILWLTPLGSLPDKALSIFEVLNIVNKHDLIDAHLDPLENGGLEYAQSKASRSWLFELLRKLN